MTRTSASYQSPRPDSDAVTSTGLHFRRQEMVDWLHPKQLATTAVKAVLSGVFGAYADKREMQAALNPQVPGASRCDADYSEEKGKEFWFDYAADVGDGFSSTYSIAWLLAQDQLILPGEEGRPPLPRGRFLVLGGDEVYPTASREEYQNRFRGPYEAAFPGEPRRGDPNLFAVPGNHDWYDGLTSYSRLFCQCRGVGRWVTRQTRSYFAVRLPANWWLWGVDIQLESDIDQPQMKFFEAVALEMRRKCPEGELPRLILCTGQPTWTECGAEQSGRRGLRCPKPYLFDNQAFFEDRIIRKNGVRLVVTLAGDLHHYMRYGESGRELQASAPGGAPAVAAVPQRHEGVQRITSGGGGAYLYPTHHMPEAIKVPEEDAKVRYRREAMFPSEADSHKEARGIVWLPFRNRMFALFVGLIYLLYAWTLQSASKAHDICPNGTPDTASLMECIQHYGVYDVRQVLVAFGRVLQHSPSNVVFGLVLILGLYQFSASEDRSWTRVFGAVHGAAHIVLCGLLIWVISIHDLRVRQWPVDSPKQAALFGVLMLIGGGIAGAWLFAFYLWASSKNHGYHLNEVFSSQHLAGYKNFLRFRISPEGLLTIHAIGVPKVPSMHAWVEQTDPTVPLFRPPEGKIAIQRIDGPVNCR